MAVTLNKIEANLFIRVLLKTNNEMFSGRFTYQFLLTLLLSNTCFSQQTIIWEVSDTIHKKTSFLVGTFHHIGNSFVDSIPFLQAALLNADIAIFESIDEESQLEEIFQKRKSEDEIKNLLSNEDFEKLKTMSSKWELTIGQLKPIELLIALEREFHIQRCKTVKLTDTFDHFDNYLIHLARKNNKQLWGLETDSLQIDILREIADTWQADLIGEEISYWISKLTIEEENYEDCSLAEQYMRMDFDYEFSTECEDDIFVKRRNDEWMKQLTPLVSQNNCFIAVGYLHLKYACGLLESFRKLGFMVKPVTVRIPGN